MEPIAARPGNTAGEDRRELRDPEIILAYLEELLRLEIPVGLWVDPQAWVAIGAHVVRVDDPEGTFTLALQRALPGDLKARQELELAFPLDGQRFLAGVRFVERGGYLQATFRLPEGVRLGDRRERGRARFGPRERARVTVLQGLFEGCGATGRLVNLSPGGLCLRVDRVVSLADDRKIPLAPELFSPGTRLEVVRIQDLPQAPMIECSGMTTHAERGAIGLTLGVRFVDLGLAEQRVLAEVLTRRLPTFARQFPFRRRRRDEDLAAPGDHGGEVWEDPPEEVGAGEALLPGPPEAASESARRHRMIRLRKGGRRILLVMLDDLDRAILAGTLHVDGYHQVVEARSFTEALRWFRTGPVDLVILESQVGAHPGQRLLERLRAQGHALETPVVLLAEAGDVRAKLVAKVARVAHLQCKPVDYDGELRGVLERLLGIA